MMKASYKYLIMGLLTWLSLPLHAQDVAKEYDLQEVEVTAKRHDFGTKSSQMSALAITAERIKQLPKLFGELDVLKSLQTMPGVQSGGEGRAGIFVRGGDYDQNLFMLDGITLYNPEHLQGFTSAINADLMDDVVLYKGAFPSRFGSRLSSVIDISLREGDMQYYHASITAGMLASRVQVEGPVWKDHTSFNIGARISYFNAIVKPLLKEVVYDNPGQMNNFSHMRYYDINAKLTHKFNENAKLNAVFYYGYDSNNATPNETSQHFTYDEYGYDRYSGEYTVISQGFIDRTDLTQRTNHWNNLLGGLFYDHQLTSSLNLKASVSYSGYDYKLAYERSTTDKKSKTDSHYRQEEIITQSKNGNETRYNSKVDDIAMHLGLSYNLLDKHEIKGGVSLNLQKIAPQISTEYINTDKAIKDDEGSLIQHDDDFVITNSSMLNMVSGKSTLTSMGAYVEDDMSLTDWLKMNIGVRLQGYNADRQNHFQVEPRASVRLLMARGLALKLSYSRMSQGVFMLTSSSLVTPSEVWMPLNKQMKPGISDQVSAGISKDFDNGIQLSVEGYYKWLDNVVDYREGVSFASAREWNDLVAQGKGRAYGVEFLAQKTTGKTRGQISYTWSKSLRTFDRPGMELNGGLEFYAAGDRRHNFNINITQRLSKNWDFSASWTYQSGRRANISTSIITGGMLNEYNNYYPEWSEVIRGYDYSQNPNFQYDSYKYDEGAYVEDIVRMNTYHNRNSYTLPAVHRLDISLSHHGSIGIGEMICDIGIYNLYNRQNLSSVYWGYDNNKYTLKGVCLFPIMPSISLTLKL